MSRYEPLRRHLWMAAADRAEVRLTFRELERIVGPLPDPARNRRPWWANGDSPQAAAWLAAGFVVDWVDLAAEMVVFVRGQAGRSPVTGQAPARRASPNAARFASVRPVVLGVVERPGILGGWSTEGPATPVRAGAGAPVRGAASVRAGLVAYLLGEGWQVRGDRWGAGGDRRGAGACQEPEADIIATLGNRILAVSVAGIAASPAGADRGQPCRGDERWPANPVTTARQVYAEVMLRAMLVRQRHPGYEAAVALPDVPALRGLHQRTRASLAGLGVAAFFVAGDGRVDPPRPAPAH